MSMRRSGAENIRNLQEYLIAELAHVRNAVELIDNATYGFAIVVDEQGKFIAAISDITLRKWLLKGISLDDTIAHALRRSGKGVGVIHAAHQGPITPASVTVDHSDLGIVVNCDAYGRRCRVQLSLPDDALDPIEEIPVVLMAGGNSTRLLPLTSHCPKPLLKVGGKPLLQRTLESFVRAGFKKFYFSVHFKADMIENFFGDGFAGRFRSHI